MNSNNMIVIDLPSLQSITLGYATLCGSDYYSSCSLILRGVIDVIGDDFNRFAKA